MSDSVNSKKKVYSIEELENIYSKATELYEDYKRQKDDPMKNIEKAVK